MSILIPKDHFIGLDKIVHLAAGGETPALKSHQDAVAQFFADKATGEAGRFKFEAMANRCRAQMGELWGVSAENIAFLSHSTEGINLFANTINWQAGDNIVIADVEFPSDVLAWTPFQDNGVEIRVVRHEDWYIDIEAIADQIDERTRVVAASHVSYFTGQRLKLQQLSQIVRNSNALLLIDATHSAGVVQVDASLADIVVSSCYKWLLGTHGVGIFYWNPDRLSDLQPHYLGWNTVVGTPDWRNPTTFTVKPTAERFEAGNPTYIGLYILNNALDHLLDIGIDNIEARVLRLSGRIWEGLAQTGVELMTPHHSAERAGNICFAAQNIRQITQALLDEGVLIWGNYGGATRVRVSSHLYNDDDDIDRFLEVVQRVNLAG